MGDRKHSNQGKTKDRFVRNRHLMANTTLLSSTCTENREKTLELWTKIKIS